MAPYGDTRSRYLPRAMEFRWGERSSFLWERKKITKRNRAKRSTRASLEVRNRWRRICRRVFHGERRFSTAALWSVGRTKASALARIVTLTTPRSFLTSTSDRSRADGPLCPSGRADRTGVSGELSRGARDLPCRLLWKKRGRCARRPGRS